MKLHLLFLLALLHCPAPAQVDPFGPVTGISWMKEFEQKKPYRLVIACAETEIPPPSDKTKPSGEGGYIVTPEFISAAKITTIAVSQNDTGAVSREDGVEIKYRLNKTEDGFALNISIKAKVGGTREVNTNITIPSSEWQVIGVMGREEVVKTKIGETTSRRYYSIAVRIDKTDPAQR